MDEKFVADLKQRMEFEVDRTCPPADWPDLPDLPLGRYTDEAFFRAEVDHVWRRSWQFVGHISQWPEPGAYRTLDLPFAPVLVVRGREDGELRAFLNSCRHRGAPVVREERGTAKYLVCQFHAWSYDLAGNLIQVPDERDFRCLDKADRALTEVSCARWGEFVFVNLDPNARSLDEEVSSLSARYGDVIEGELRHVRSTEWELNCNWKLAVEAFVEIYHFSTVHKNSAAPFADTRSGVNFTHPYGNSSGILPFRTDLEPDAEKALDFFFPPDLKRIPGAPEFYRVANPNFHLFPGLVCPADYTGFPFLVWRPMAVDRTWMEWHWFGPDWGSGERPQGWDFKMGAFDILMQEDTANLEPIQRSLQAAAHKGVPLNYQERRIWHFHRYIDELIGVGNVPDGLQVPDLIKHYQEA